MINNGDATRNYIVGTTPPLGVWALTVKRLSRFQMLYILFPRVEPGRQDHVVPAGRGVQTG